jgi:hypothetical protein
MSVDFHIFDRGSNPFATPPSQPYRIVSLDLCANGCNYVWKVRRHILQLLGMPMEPCEFYFLMKKLKDRKRLKAYGIGWHGVDRTAPSLVVQGWRAEESEGEGSDSGSDHAEDGEEGGEDKEDEGGNEEEGG